MSLLSHLVLQNRLSSYSDMHNNNNMSTSNAYSIQLPYLGTIPLGKSPPNLSSFQKPLRELYIPYYRQRRERHYDERRIIISDRDILIFEPDAASKGKRSLIYSTLESIVDIQALELYIMFNHTENHHHKRIRAAFLPIGCEDQERFRSLYSTIDKSQYNLLSTSSSTTSCHPPLILFVMKKTGTGGTCSLLDCHVFAVRRETIAFELCDMIRKLIIKRTMSPILPTSKTKGTTLLRINDNIKDINNNEKNIKYLDRDRPISAMEHRHMDIDKKNDLIHLTNPLLSSSSFHMNQNSNMCNDTSQVLPMENDIQNSSLLCPPSTTTRTLRTKQHHHHHHQNHPTQQRHFIKASSSTSSLIMDESDEVVNDLMNIVVQEKLKTIDTNICQIPIKRHASFDHSSSSNGCNDHQTINKKRYQFHHYQNHNNKKRSIILNSNPLPTIISANNTPVISRSATTITNNDQQQTVTTASIIDNHLLRTPHLIVNRYGDIGNYVPKLLRENSTTTMRSSDSNENIFFRATNGHILNGFLNLDFSSTQPIINGNLNNNNNNTSTHYRSSPCLNDENSEKHNIYPFIKQLNRNQTKSFIHEKELSISTNPTYPIENLDHHVPSSRMAHVINQSPSTKLPTAMGGIKVLPSTSHPHQHYIQRPFKTSYSTSNAKPKRVASFTIADTELPIDYRQFLRHTDQAVYLYGEEQQRQQQQQQQQQSTTLEHSLGYYP